MHRSFDSLKHSIMLTLNSQMSLLDNRIITTNTILYTFPESNQHCIEILIQKEDKFFIIHP